MNKLKKHTSPDQEEYGGMHSAEGSTSISEQNLKEEDVVAFALTYEQQLREVLRSKGKVDSFEEGLARMSKVPNENNQEQERE